MCELRDISTYYNTHHPSTCPCDMDVTKFMNEYKPNNYQEDKAEEILLAVNIPTTNKDYLFLVKKHFLILAQRFHPDKNNPSNESACKTTMGNLNQAFCAIERKHHKHSKQKAVAVKEGKVYSYLAEDIIACKHHESVAAYCHPAYVDQWKALLTQEWNKQPANVQKGIQFGDRRQSLYINVFDSGTVFMQGNLALSYAAENLERLISSLSTPTSMKPNKRSKLLKEAVKLFPDIKHGAFPLEILAQQESSASAGRHVTTLQSENTREANYNLSSEKTAMLPATGEDSSHNSTLELAMSMIETLENKLNTMQKHNQENHLEMKKRIDILEKENRELRNSLGPKISYLIQQGNHVKVSSDRSNATPLADHHASTSPNTPATAEAIENRKPEHDWQVVQPKRNSTKNPFNKEGNITGSKVGKIAFQVDKVVIVESIEDTSKTTSDDKIRREIGWHIDKVIIDRITHYPHNNKKLMIQFATQQMRDLTLSTWKPNVMFGKSTIRTPNKQQPNTIGVAKGVPLDMSDTELTDDIQKTFPDATYFRMTKGPSKEKLRTVKIYFANSSDLDKAVTEGIKLHSQSQYVRVEHLTWTPHVRHCSSCWRIGHSTSQCISMKACVHCGTNANEGSHLICVEQPRCRNCSGAHSADQRDQCPAYKKKLEQIVRRHQSLQDGS